MLWYKSWLETRWQFLIGFAILVCSAAGCVFTYPQVVKLIPLVPMNLSGRIGEEVRRAAELSRTFRGFVWSHWFHQNLEQMATLFAVLLGTANFLSESRGALFTMSLPVSRKRLVGVRVATGLAELFALVFLSSLLIPLLSPSIGESYALSDVLIHSICTFLAAAVFFSLAFLLSTIFDDLWRPILIVLAIAVFLSIVDQILRSPQWSVYHLMSGETYFLSGGMPWIAMITAAVVSTFFYTSAAMNIARHDY